MKDLLLPTFELPVPKDISFPEHIETLLTTPAPSFPAPFLLPVTTITLPEIDIKPVDIPYFRAAVAAQAGWDTDAFHNHREGKDNYLYRYPSIQYRTTRAGAQVVAIGQESADAVKEWLWNMPNTWRIGRKTLKVSDTQVNRQVHECRLLDTPVFYRLNDWVALNQENYRNWQQLPSLESRAKELDRLLGSNIIAFAKAIGWQIPGRFEITVQHIRRVRRLSFKGTPVMGFDLTFSTPLQLPPAIGLGRKTAFGFGACHPAPEKWM